MLLLMRWWSDQVIPGAAVSVNTLLFALGAPFLLSSVIWLVFDWPIFMRHKFLTSFAIAAFCLAVYWLQPFLDKEIGLTPALYVLVIGTVISFFILFTSPASAQYVNMKEGITRLKKQISHFFGWLISRFF